MLPNLEKLQEIIRQTARRELLPRFTEVTAERKADGSIVTVADIAMQIAIQQALAQHWPEYSFLGEEMSDAEQQALLENYQIGLWCLDPLDGTSNFASGLPFFAVSLALIVDGEICLGVIYDPLRDECFSALKGQGAWLNGVRMRPHTVDTPLRSCIAVIDFKRLPPGLSSGLIEQPIYSSQRNFGSVALEWCWLAAGRFHVYLHGKQKLWDYAAGSLILAETGGFAISLEGKDMREARLQSCSVVAALDSALFTEWKDCIKNRSSLCLQHDQDIV